jgi:flagellar biosynthesis protein FlhF
MAEALAAVKRDLGANAVILNTRAFKRGGILGIGRKTVIEVTATAQRESNERSARTAPRRTRAAAPLVRKAYQNETKSSGPDLIKELTGRESATPVMDPALEDRTRTQRLAQALLAQHERKQSPSEVSTTSPTAAEDKPIPPSVAPTETAAVSINEPDAAGKGSLPVARRYVLRDAEQKTQSPVTRLDSPTEPSLPPIDPGTIPPPRRPVALVDRASIEPPQIRTGRRSDADSRDLQEELHAIREMVGHVLQRQTIASDGTPTPTMPKHLFDVYLKLIGQEVSEELADRILNDVRGELSGVEIEDESRVREAVVRHLADYIPTAEEPVTMSTSDGVPLVIALVGPTGVGKTTTVAKLAASFKLRHHRKVGLITSDTYRIAAVDQLRTYANIIGLPLEIVVTPGEMRQAVHVLGDCDVILIDTAGRSQHDDDRIAELKQFIEASSPHEVHLVLSSTASEKVLLREAEAFAAVGVDKIVLTKLDEAVSFGVLINVVRTVGKKLSFFTTGQEVPDHIELGRAERLAELVLGGEVNT